jgi:hypothetical protein
MPKQRFVLVLLAAALGCSSDDSGGSSGEVRNQVNACATKGATYLQQCVEHAGGTCGPLSDQVINIDDPAITASVCASVTQQNCVARGTACKVSENGCEVTASYMTTFKADGSSATSSSSITIKCNDGSWCNSAYDCKMTRL